ncbi:MAG: translation initiation factor IF-2 [Simkaniaceae bacterium]|nr:translation initiation factor IF-2 [Simkaniaceae bacterium]
MAKNLKLKIKNTQLAEALKKNKLGKEAKPAPKVGKVPLAPKGVKAVSMPMGSPVRKHATPRTESSPVPKSSETSPDHEDLLERKESSETGTPDGAGVTSTPPAREIGPEEREVSPDGPAEQALSTESSPKKESTPPKSSPAPSGRTDFRDTKKRESGKFGKEERRQEGFRAELSRAGPLKQTRFDSRDRHGLRIGEERTYRRRRPRSRSQNRSHTGEPIDVVRPATLSVRLPISLKELAQMMKLKASVLISKLFMQGVSVTLNDLLDDETTVQLLGHEFDCEITIDTGEERRLKITDKTIAEEIAETDPERLRPRAPVVAFMGHVDHGKTSLVDAIRKSNLADREAGSITQHIGAFTFHAQNGNITVLDTPGHEAFSMMRMRGTAITDLLVLVVSGEEGVMPQTEEVVGLAQSRDVPLLVAVSKSDREAFDPERVYRQLSDRDLLPEAWGGSVVTVNCSAKTGEGIAELVEMLLLQSELLELRADPTRRARGSVIESALHKGFGPVATVLVRNGTLRVGDALVVDEHCARVKTLHDENGHPLREAGPSSPVRVTGLSGVPVAGNEFIVVDNEKEARKLACERASGAKRNVLQHVSQDALDNFLKNHRERVRKKVLLLILRADVQGSLEALKTSLSGIESTKVELNFITEGVGEISESDVELAMVSGACVIGFHVGIESHAANLIKQKHVVIKRSDIIYRLVEEVKELMLHTLDKIRNEAESGTVDVKKIFKSSRLGTIAGCIVTEGTVKRGQYAKVIRNGEIVWEGDITSLKREKETIKEAPKGWECGILLEKFNDVLPEDIIKTFDISYVRQEL